MKFRDLHPNIKWRFVVGFLTSLSYMMVGPFLVIFFSNKIGAGITGALYLLIIVSAIVGSFVGGYLSDQYGRVKLLFSTELMAALTFLLIAFLNSPWYDSPYLTALAFVFYTFFNGCFQPVTTALILDSSTPETREGIFRINYWLHNLAMAIGSLVGGFLFMDHHFLLFVIVSCMSIVSVVITALFLKDVRKPNQENQPVQGDVKKKASPLINIAKSYQVVFQDRVFLLFLIGSVFVFSLETHLTNYIGIRLANNVIDATLFMNWSINGTELLGLLRSENTILVVVGTIFIAYITKRLKNQTKFLGGAILYAVSFVFISYLTTPWLLIIVMLFATIGELIFVPIRQAMLGNLAPEDSRSAYMAVNQSFMATTEIIAGIFIIISTFVSAPTMTSLFALMGGIGILCFAKLTKKQGVISFSPEESKSVG